MFLITSKLKKLENVIKQLTAVDKIRITNKNASDVELKIKKLHLLISEYFFKAIKEKNVKIIDKVIKSNHIRAHLVYNEKGLNVVQYSVIESNNELFKLLYCKYYKYIKCYFNEIPSLFLIAISKRNTQMIEYFLSEKIFYSYLLRDNICVCFYMAIQENRAEIVELILQNAFLESKLEVSDIQSLLIYSISHNQYDKLKYIFACKNLIFKLEKTNIQNILALIVFNKDIKALDIIIDNECILNFIMSDRKILETITLFAYSNNNVRVLTLILKKKKKVGESGSLDDTAAKTKKSTIIEDSL